MKKTITTFIKTQLLLVVLMCLGCFTVNAQVSVTATAGTTGPTPYTTVNAAFAAINAGTHNGDITITVTANTTETTPATQLVSSGTGSALYTSVAIRPSGDVVINSAATPTASRGILEFIGADFITIDGDDPLTAGTRNLTIQMASTGNAGTACLRFSSSSSSSNGCTNVTVKNCNIIGGRNSSTGTTTSFGIFSGLSTAAATITTASGAADNDSMLIENNEITRAYYGIYCYGITAYAMDYLRIRNNTVGSATVANSVGFRGIYVANTQSTATANSVLIEGNDVRGGDPTTGMGTSIAGIDLNVTNAGATVRNNNIHDVKNPSSGGWGSYGLFISSATNNAGIHVYNNFIRDITAFHYTSGISTFTNYGIYVNVAVQGLKINHNTIVLSQPNSGSGTSNFSACIAINNGTATVVDLRNNILINTQSDNTGQACMSVYFATSTQASTGTMDRNCYFVSGPSGYVGRVTTVNYPTLTSWKNVTTKDSASLYFSPSFVSSTDLHLAAFPSGLESAGALTSVLTDIDGNVRPGPIGSVNGGGTAPDIGADEADMSLPVVPGMATGGFSNVTTNAATLNGSIVHNGGTNVITSGIVVGTSPNPTRGGIGVIDSVSNPLVISGNLTASFTGLNLGTMYYYRAYAENSAGTGYGPDSVFTTNASAVAPTITKTPATNVLAYTATVGGNITTDGGAPVTASGIVYSTSPNPALGGPGVIDSATNPVVALGSFSKGLGGMTHSTKYYFRAYATNSAGTSYSAEDSFTTQIVVSTLPYLEDFEGTTTSWTSGIVNGTLDEWQLGSPAKVFINGPFAGTKAYVTKLTGTYAGSDCAVTSPQMDFSAQTNAPIIRFKHKFDTDADINWDGGVLEISINNGPWTRLDNATGTGSNFNTANSTAWYNNNVASGTLGANKFNGISSSYSSQAAGWLSSATPLTGAAGQSNVKVRFRFWADAVGLDEGWAIDNIEIYPPTAPVVSTGGFSNVTTSSVTLTGAITDNGGNAVTQSGIVVATTPNPVKGGFGVIDSVTNPAVASGAMSIGFTGLNNSTVYYYRTYATNGVGTTYGPDSVFTTNAAATLATVSKTPATNILAYTATFGGSISSDGGAAVTASGIVYSTSPNPAVGGVGVVDSTTNPLVALGSFSFNTAGLNHSTKYYYRAYATNSVGTAYSAEDSFTTQIVITTLPYFEDFEGVSTSWTSSIVAGTVNDWAFGTPAKTYLNGAFSGTKAFVTRLTGNYAGSDCAVVSPQMDFTALTASPVIRFKHKFDTDADINWDGGVLEISINNGPWTRLDNATGTGTNFNTPISTAWYNNNVASGTLGSNKFNGISSSYSSHASGWLTSSTPLTGAAGQSNVKVRFRFWADAIGLDEGWAIDNIELFSPVAPSVVTGTSSNITTSNATLSGNITDNGGNPVTSSGIVIGILANPSKGDPGVIDSVTSPLVTGGAFTISTTGLTAATTYHYRAYATNGVGTTYGPDSVFTTNAAAVAPSVSIVAATNVAAYTVTAGGNITSDGGAPVTASGIVYGTSINPTIGGPGVVDSTTTPVVAMGAFSVNPAGLTHSTKYYFRAYATNAAGTSYSNMDSFTTAPIVSALPYTQNFESGAQGWGTVTISGTNNWVLGTPAKTYLSGANSGTQAWVTKLTGTYDNSVNSAVVSPQFDLSALTEDPVLRFYHKFITEAGWDGMVVEISINGGTWTKLDPNVGTGGNFNTTNSYAWYDNVSVNGPIAPPKFSSNSFAVGSDGIYSSQTNGWIQSATRLTGAAGQSNVKIRFVFGSDLSGIDEGFALDDIEVLSIVTPTTAASNVAATPGNTTANVTFTAGNGNGRLVVARLATDATVAPTNYTMYTANATFGSGSTTGTGNYVVYNGTGTSVNVTGLAQLTNYTFDVYESEGKYMHVKYTSAANINTTTTPVKLVSFSGSHKNGSALLTWSTASEVNNRGFNVERSIDGKNFEFVTFVKGAGNSSATLRYGMTDADVFSKTGAAKIYYRLKQLDFDGKSTYSHVITIANDEQLTFKATAFPVPFSNELSIQVEGGQPGNASVIVTDIQGRVILDQTYTLDSGSDMINLTNAEDLTAGVYFVKLAQAGQSQVIRIIKK